MKSIKLYSTLVAFSCCSLLALSGVVRAQTTIQSTGGPILLNPLEEDVGIGTTNPSEALHVSGGVALFDNATIVSGADSHSGLRLVAVITTAQYNWMIGAQENVDAALEITPSTAVGGTTFSTPVAVFKESGNVGIGTTSPSFKLQVNGTVRATEFISDTTTYADFVFAKDYPLPSLSEVERVINSQGHLPGIPSAAEAKAHGINLADMQVKLLQKIEELTLQQIRLEKENANLAGRVAELERRPEAY